MEQKKIYTFLITAIYSVGLLNGMIRIKRESPAALSQQEIIPMAWKRNWEDTTAKYVDLLKYKFLENPYIISWRQWRYNYQLRIHIVRHL